MAFLAPLAPIALAGATGLIGTVGARVGKKLSDLFGLKKGGVSGSAKAVKARLKRATVKKTGVHTLPVGSMVIPAKLANKVRAVANRKPKKVKNKKVKQMSKGGVASGKKVLLHKNELVISPNPYRKRKGGRH
jgi:hypothetical protein